MQEEAFDVAVVGYGPTGLVLASLLGGMGHRVVVIERWPTLYGLPRLSHIDGETARLLSFACNLEDALRDASPIRSFIFCNAKGKKLLDVASIPTLPMAHPAHISIHQPDVEAAVDARVRTHASVTVRQGTELKGIAKRSDGVHLTVAGPKGQATLRARFVFAADGARSFVRKALGIEREDFGFNERWLNIDCERKRALPTRFEEAKQYCDPARGQMLIPIGKNRQRFEFAVLRHESTELMEKPETAWNLLREHHGIGPDDVSIVRQTVYTFECRLANSWRSGPVVLGGDAAHTMPPYLGQGACSGIRDAANLAWKFDLILRGKASDKILDTYEIERKPHVSHIMKAACSFGKVANTHSRTAAFFRDLVFRLNLVPPPPPFPAMPDGVVQSDRAGAAGKRVGSVPPQGLVRVDGSHGRLDEITGYRFALISRTNPLAQLAPQQAAFLDDLGCLLFTLGDDATGGVRRLDDVEGTYSRYLAEQGKHAMLTRPDTNLFGFASEAADLSRLVDELKSKLCWQETVRRSQAA